METIKNSTNTNKIMLIIAITTIIILTVAILAALSFSTPHIMAPKSPNAPTTQNILSIYI